MEQDTLGTPKKAVGKKSTVMRTLNSPPHWIIRDEHQRKEAPLTISAYSTACRVEDCFFVAGNPGSLRSHMAFRHPEKSYRKKMIFPVLSVVDVGCSSLAQGFHQHITEAGGASIFLRGKRKKRF